MQPLTYNAHKYQLVMKINIQNKKLRNGDIQLQLSYSISGRRKQQIVPGAIYTPGATKQQRRATKLAQAAAMEIDKQLNGRGMASTARRYAAAPSISTTKRTQLLRVAELWESAECSPAPLETLTAADTAKFARYIAKYAPNTRRTYIAQLVWMLNQERSRDSISTAERDAMLSALAKPAAEKDNRAYIEPQDIERLFATPIPAGCSAIVADAFKLSYYTGLRYSDIRQLTQDNLTADYIRVAMHKTGSRVTVPIADAARTIIARNTQLFAALPPQTTQANRELAAWAAAAEVQTVHTDGSRGAVTFHAARHSCATGLLNKGVPIEQVSALLGHRSISTTQVYAKIINQTLSAAVALL